MLNVVWMEREFDAYKLSRSMYPSIFNSFPVIQNISAKIAVSRTAAHIFVFPGDAPGTITQYVAWMERQFNTQGRRKLSGRYGGRHTNPER